MPQRAAANGQLIKHFRKLLRITQEELAAQSDLSIRVIAKAEAGGTLDHETLEAIAAAFCEQGYAVMLADLAADPGALAMRFLRNYAHYHAECVTHSRHIISPDIVAFIDGDPATNPIAGYYHGIEEFDQLWRKFFTLFIRDGGTIPDATPIVVGNDVIAWGHEHIRIPEVPPQPPGFVMVKMTFANGLMVRFEDYYESTGMVRALKEWAEEYPDAEWNKLIHGDAMRPLQ